VPYGIKDLICSKGVRTASGSFAYHDFIPDEDDVVVERLHTAGAGSGAAVASGMCPIALGSESIKFRGVLGVGPCWCRQVGWTSSAI